MPIRSHQERADLGRGVESDSGHGAYLSHPGGAEHIPEAYRLVDDAGFPCPPPECANHSDSAAQGMGAELLGELVADRAEVGGGQVGYNPVAAEALHDGIGRRLVIGERTRLQLTRFHLALLMRKEQIADRADANHRRVDTAVCFTGVEAGCHGAVSGQGGCVVVPSPEVVQLAPDPLGPLARSVRGERRTLGLVGLDGEFASGHGVDHAPERWKVQRGSCTIRRTRIENSAFGPVAQRLEQGTHNPRRAWRYGVIVVENVEMRREEYRTAGEQTRCEAYLKAYRRHPMTHPRCETCNHQPKEADDEQA